METECGIVKRVDGNYAVIEADAVSFCSTCENHTCTMRQSRGRQIMIENTLGAATGDRVFFVFPSKGILLSSVVLYGIPIVFLIAGIIIGAVLSWPFHDKDFSGIITGMVFLIFSFGIMRLASQYIVQHRQLTPTMVKVEKPK
ncbi:MAG TPA: SoxR reducing system RseC family protein [Spirochaetota bacterium]|nr:SoxR reducing system RseC family protein [Spirochaetota bacterium]HOM09081.1 SoxR reducing system RseC family protein [Spirochaetota bacterium]HPP48970.1 SoxR reducing system RseC family protein [Spirochaetota bacterium]